MSGCYIDTDYDADYEDDDSKYFKEDEYAIYDVEDFLRWYYGKLTLDDYDDYYDIEKDPQYYYEELC